MTLSTQLVWLLVLAAPVACVAWTVTHEEIFAEVHDWCVRQSRRSRSVFVRKFFYVFTCEYCFSHYVAAVTIALTNFRLLVDGWQGAVIAWFAVVWIANVYMSLFVRLRLDIKRERVEINVEEQRAADLKETRPNARLDEPRTKDGLRTQDGPRTKAQGPRTFS